MRLYAAILAFALSATIFAEVKTTDLEDMRKLTADGKYEEALAKFLWFHEESKKTPAMVGVRLSFALLYWSELGQKYPKAFDEMKAIRDQNEKMLLSGKSGAVEFQEYVALNRTLKEDDKSYDLFKQLHSRYPDVAAKCFHIVFSLIVQRKDYELCRGYIKNPIQSYEDIRQMREMNIGLASRNPTMQDTHLKDYSNKTFVEKTSQLIDVLVNLKRFDDAKEIQKRALAYFPNQTIREAIPGTPGLDSPMRDEVAETSVETPKAPEMPAFASVGYPRPTPPPLPTPPPTPVPTPASTPTPTPVEVNIDILSKQAPNVALWITSPLDTFIPKTIYSNVTFLTESLKDEALENPVAGKKAYALGGRLCSVLLAALEERKLAEARTGGDVVLHQTSNLTESRRDHLTWPQFALERDERAERHERAAKADHFQDGQSAVLWSIRANQLRAQIDSTYGQFRQALRETRKRK